MSISTFTTTGLLKMSIIIIILLIGAAANGVVGVPVSKNCAAQYQESLNQTMVLKKTCAEAEFRDCCQANKASLIFNNYSPESGVYDITNVCEDSTPFTLDVLPAMQVRCDMKTDDGGWMVLVRRTPDTNPRINFHERTWVEYENGFGDLNAEFWYGLKNIHCLTKREPMQVRFDLKRTDDTSATWTYNTFRVDGPDTQYTLHIGDRQEPQSRFDYLAYHNGMKFSTRDKDNDQSSTRSCSTLLVVQGAWWFNDCYRVFLTGPPSVGAQTWVTSAKQPYPFAEMKIRPLSCNDVSDTCDSE